MLRNSALASDVGLPSFVFTVEARQKESRLVVSAAMAAAQELDTASRYVKLSKDHDTPLEEIRPGELNQPVHVPQVFAPI